MNVPPPSSPVVQIPLPEALFKRLKLAADPFVETTPAAVIEKLLNWYESKPALAGEQASASLAATVDADTTEFDPVRPPDLFHTRARGVFGNTSFSNWNDLVRTAHIEAFKKAGTFEALKAVTHAQVRKGEHGDSGYRYLPEIGVSVQGVDSNHAWSYSLRLAQYLKVPIWVFVEWRHNDNAAYPGKQGSLKWVAKSSS
jgi:hypothetical protein